MKPTRLSEKERLIFDILASACGKKMYGLEMVAASGNRLKRGTVYVTLDRMQDKGFVESEQEPPGPGVRGIPRRMYQMTGHGARVYRAWETWLDVSARGAPELALKGGQ